MCGIVGYIGARPVEEVLINSLKRLEYRGYDSSGVALLLKGQIEIRKSKGRLENVEKLLNGEAQNLKGAVCGIGHTRWATHGKPSTQNAHPHKTGHVVLVHNGIIENYLDIRKEVVDRGYQPISETDSELFGFLVLDEMERGASLLEGVRKSFSRLKGECSVVVMSEREPGILVGVRNGSPLVAAEDTEGGVILASDAHPLIHFNRKVYFLEHGDLVVATRSGLKFYDLNTGHSLDRSVVTLDWSTERLDKAGHPHYMLKEIYEQPDTLVETLNEIVDRSGTGPFPMVDQPALRILESAQELVLLACGSSWHACLLGKYWIEQLAGLPVSVELASEFRYREPVVRPGSVVIGVSQSGETADTLAVMREMRKRNVPVLGVTNVRGSTMFREADAVFYTSAGPEIGVAATKTFTAQMLMMLLFAGRLATKRKNRDLGELSRSFEDLVKLPHLLSRGLSEDVGMISQIRAVVQALEDAKGFFFIGRGFSFPVALEGALKLKEIAYDYAEGYAAGELKHGPIAMIDQGMVVVVLAPRDPWRAKTVSNLEEVRARGATIVGVGDPADRDLQSLCDHWIPLPIENRSISPSLLPFILTPVVQLFSYYRAVLKGTDVDKPRNLAKSVTVE